MLTGLYVLVVGGDERQLEVIEKLHALDAHVRTIGFELETDRTAHVIKTKPTEEEFARSDILILPVTGLNDDGTVEATYAESTLHVSDKQIAALPQHAKIFTGFSGARLRELTNRLGIECIELLARDDLAIFNSIPTAEGAIGLAIEHTKKTIHSSLIIVLGFGRVGMTLARLLKAMGANVNVGVNSDEQFARATEMGLTPFNTQHTFPVSIPVDLIFNTIPSMIITASVIHDLPRETVIIDLASKPGGTDFRFAEKRQIKAFLAPSLPGIVAPKTAGTMLAATICQLIPVHAKERTSNEY